MKESWRAPRSRPRRWGKNGPRMASRPRPGAERDELRARLADATARLNRSEAANAQLESEVADLREATGPATDVAREDLAETPTLPAAGEGAPATWINGVFWAVDLLFSCLPDLPPEKRQHVQGLLADLHSNLDERGLMTTGAWRTPVRGGQRPGAGERLRHARQGRGSDQHVREQTGAHHWP